MAFVGSLDSSYDTASRRNSTFNPFSSLYSDEEEFDADFNDNILPRLSGTHMSTGEPLTFYATCIGTEILQDTRKPFLPGKRRSTAALGRRRQSTHSYTVANGPGAGAPDHLEGEESEETAVRAAAAVHEDGESTDEMAMGGMLVQGEGGDEVSGPIGGTGFYGGGGSGGRGVQLPEGMEPAPRRERSSLPNSRGQSPGVICRNIRDGSRWSRGKTYTSYVLLVTRSMDEDAWVISRRYHAFHALFEGLRDAGIDLTELPPFPKKKLIDTLKPALVENRRAMLDMWIREVLQHPASASLPVTAAFLDRDDDSSRRTISAPKITSWDHSGFLVKQKRRAKTWVTRWFVLDQATRSLYYYRNQDDAEACGVFMLQFVSELTAGPPSPDSGHYPISFFYGGKKRSYFSDSEVDRDSWKDAISSCMGKGQGFMW